MLVYHGSNRDFSKLRIASSLMRYKASLDNEGLGIYWSTDINVAKSYGEYLYELEINETYFRDFTKLSVCIRYVQEIRKYIVSKISIDIAQYINIRSIAEGMHDGDFAIAATCREIYLNLDSNPDWYELSNTKIERVYSILRAYDKKHLQVYAFTYKMIPNIGVCKTVSPDVVRIVQKYKLT